MTSEAGTLHEPPDALPDWPPVRPRPPIPAVCPRLDLAPAARAAQILAEAPYCSLARFAYRMGQTYAEAGRVAHRLVRAGACTLVADGPEGYPLLVATGADPTTRPARVARSARDERPVPEHGHRPRVEFGSAAAADLLARLKRGTKV